MAGDKKISAVWVGPAGQVLYDGTPLVPGETVVEIGAFEAESNHWQPVAKTGGKQKSDPESDA